MKNSFRDAIDTSKIYPTHTCFDDALDFIDALISGADTNILFPSNQNKFVFHLCDVWLVHGLILWSGKRFSHAWVKSADLIIQAGFFDMKASSIRFKSYFALPKESFIEEFNPEDMTEYSIPDAIRMNYRYGHYGPWEEKYLSHCLGGSDERKPGNKNIESVGWPVCGA